MDGEHWVSGRGLDVTTITYAEWEAVLARARLGVGAAELHGSVAGFLCTGWTGPAAELLAALQLEGDDAALLEPLHGQLEPAMGEIAAALRSGAGVMPLLPAAPLAARADAMVDWCRGFLGGLGLTGTLADALSAPATRDLLDAFAQIASMHLESDDDEAALAEVLEFIQGGTAHLYAALAPPSLQ